MTRTTKKAAAKLNTAIAGAVKRFAPPESLTVDEWADKHRRLSPESSAEAGPWRTKRTPYLEEPMRAFTDPKVHKIVMVAASQVGKSELELNIIGYIIDVLAVPALALSGEHGWVFASMLIVVERIGKAIKKPAKMKATNHRPRLNHFSDRRSALLMRTPSIHSIVIAACA